MVLISFQGFLQHISTRGLWDVWLAFLIHQNFRARVCIMPVSFQKPNISNCFFYWLHFLTDNFEGKGSHACFFFPLQRTCQQFCIDCIFNALKSHFRDVRLLTLSIFIHEHVTVQVSIKPRLLGSVFFNGKTTMLFFVGSIFHGLKIQGRGFTSNFALICFCFTNPPNQSVQEKNANQIFIFGFLFF